MQSELDKALPALQAAEDALNVLTKKDMSELKAYANPPALVELTLGKGLALTFSPTHHPTPSNAVTWASWLKANVLLSALGVCL